MKVNFPDVDKTPNKFCGFAPSEQMLLPVVVVVQGFRNSWSTHTLLARAIASQGAVVFRLDVAFKIPCLTSIDCVEWAIRFARVRIAVYGGDAKRISMVGI